MIATGLNFIIGIVNQGKCNFERMGTLGTLTEVGVRSRGLLNINQEVDGRLTYIIESVKIILILISRSQGKKV